MFERNPDVLLTLYIIVVFIAFISGLFLGALFSPNRRKEYEPWHARLAAAEAKPAEAKPAEAKPRGDGKERGIKLLAVVTALIVVFGSIVLDHFKGPFLPDELYCFSDGGTQIAGKCTGRRDSSHDTVTDIRGRAPLPE